MNIKANCQWMPSTRWFDNFWFDIFACLWRFKDHSLHDAEDEKKLKVKVFATIFVVSEVFELFFGKIKFLKLFRTLVSSNKNQP